MMDSNGNSGSDGESSSELRKDLEALEKYEEVLLAELVACRQLKRELGNLAPPGSSFGFGNALLVCSAGGLAYLLHLWVS
jgi:hypothetical protein